MKIHLANSWTLTDEHPKVERGNPILIDLGTWKAYHPRDRIGEVPAPQFVSLAVEARGKNNFLPEEIQFISRFKDGNNAIQSSDETQVDRARKREEEIKILRGSHP